MDMFTATDGVLFYQDDLRDVYNGAIEHLHGMLYAVKKENLTHNAFEDNECIWLYITSKEDLEKSKSFLAYYGSYVMSDDEIFYPDDNITIPSWIRCKVIDNGVFQEWDYTYDINERYIRGHLHIMR